MGELVDRIAFDEAIFGVPFFRVADPAHPDLASAFRDRVSRLDHAMADARCAVDDRDALRRSLDLGFRRVCTQITLTGTPREGADDPGVTEAARWPLSEGDLARHARGFRFSRFGQDVCVPPPLAERWIAAWLANSVSGRRRVLAIGPDLVTFAPPRADGVLTVDLVSVIRTRRGHASRLVAHLLAVAARAGARSVEVTTEAENVAAQRLYLGAGFTPTAARACLHWGSPREA